MTDPELVGTEEQVPIRWRKPTGDLHSVAAADVKEAVDEADASAEQSQEQSSTDTDGKVTPAQFTSNEYGAYWGSYNNTEGVLRIRWQSVRAAGEGRDRRFAMAGATSTGPRRRPMAWRIAIIRISYGWDNGFDKTKLAQYLAECKLGMQNPLQHIQPFIFAMVRPRPPQRGNDLVGLLKKGRRFITTSVFPVYYGLRSDGRGRVSNTGRSMYITASWRKMRN